jgi:opacity protein-like surface antigen
MKRNLSMAFILIAIMSLALAASPVFGGNGNGVENAKQAQEKVNQKVLSKKDVVGTAVGLDSEGNAIIRVFTAKSGVGGIPKEQDGVKIVAQVTGPINSLGFASVPVLIPSAQSTTAR